MKKIFLLSAFILLQISIRAQGKIDSYTITSKMYPTHEILDSTYFSWKIGDILKISSSKICLYRNEKLKAEYPIEEQSKQIERSIICVKKPCPDKKYLTTIKVLYCPSIKRYIQIIHNAESYFTVSKDTYEGKETENLSNCIWLTCYKMTHQ